MVATPAHPDPAPAPVTPFNGGASTRHSPAAAGVQVPNKLAFAQPPTDLTSGGTFSPVIVVNVLDVNNSVCTNATNAVTLTINSSGADALTGTVTRAAVAGVATFTGLGATGTLADTLTAAASGLASAVSATFAVNDRAE